MRKASPNTSPYNSLHGTPYETDLQFCAGVYRIVVGKFFYIGSTTSFGSRVSDHKAKLELGIHPNHRLQAAYAENPVFTALLVMEIPRKEIDREKDHQGRLKMHEQKFLDRFFGTPGCVNLSSSSGFNTTIGEFMKERWQDPGFRERRTAEIRTRAQIPKKPETLKKMSIAKRGGRNVNARACVLEFRGEEFRFDTGTEAADHFGVTQQTMDLWLRGIVPWPGKGKRKPRAGGHLVGLTGRYTDHR